GIQTNGIQTNGIQTNGIQTNGIQTNGTTTSGVTYSGLSVNGTQLSYIGQGTSVYPYTCGHREDVTGAALNNCSPCSMTVGNADSYCRNNYWDSLCVSAAKSMCNLGAGTVMTATFTDGRSAQMRIDSTATGASSVWNGSVYVDNTDVTYSRVSWVLAHAPSVTGAALLAGSNSCTNQVCNLGGAGYRADSYCCNYSWDSQCVKEANAMCGATTSTVAATSTQGASVCGTTGKGTAIQAVFLSGVWDQNWGTQGNGSKTASTSMFTIGCRGVGAVAKCVDMGYKPWRGAQHDALHQTCIRMVRADYCGDGNSFTQNGTQINVQDHFYDDASKIQTYGTSGGSYEASWDTLGARFVDHYWFRGGSPGDVVSAYDGTPLTTYFNARTDYCRMENAWSGMANFNADGTTNLITNLRL
ncbi:MAG: hypothetical protein H0T89_12245, partial [Deltaproteobacteria bacterium]|nr:hypothetical protein [Deltaproteobacteria bacterium]